MTRRQDWNAQVLVLCPEGTKLGKMAYRDAQRLASEDYDLDLVQVNKDHELPVYKIMDHGKWKYNQRKHKKKAHTHHVKEMNFKVRIEAHDLAVKINQIKGFLSKGDDVRISVVMKGREKAHPELARDKMNTILSELGYTGEATDSIRVQPVKSSASSMVTTVRRFRSDKDNVRDRIQHGQQPKTQKEDQNQGPSGNGRLIRQRNQKSQRENVKVR